MCVVPLSSRKGDLWGIHPSYQTKDDQCGETRKYPIHPSGICPAFDSFEYDAKRTDYQKNNQAARTHEIPSFRLETAEKRKAGTRMN